MEPTLMPLSFCTRCGKQEIEELTENYDYKTGHRVTRRVCPDDPCGHSGHSLVTYRGNYFLSLLLGTVKRCVRCKKTFSFHDT